MIRRTLRVWSILAALLATTSAAAQEWTRFRGPNGAGQSEATTIPASWGAQDYLWKVELPGKGNSSPVLWGERIFLNSADPAGGTRYVVCLSARDGRLLWKREFPATTHRIHAQNSFASSTPTVDDKRVYCAWATPEEFTLVALDHQGRDAWRADLGRFTSLHGFATSPIVYRDSVIVTGDQDADSFLVALDAASGTIRWKVPRKVHEQQNASFAVPCIYAREGAADELIVCGWAHGISSIDPASGATHWETPVFERRPVGSPILVEGLVLASCGDGAGNNTMLAVRPPDGKSSEPETVYKIDRNSAPYVPSLVAMGRLVFLWSDRGVVTCVDGPSGKIHWQKRVGGNYFSSPVRVADRVYGVSVDGEVVTLAAKSEYELLGRSPLGETTRATPAVAGGRMFLRTESHLVAVGQP
jgi:outer membrane protein assembly factor BamB